MCNYLVTKAARSERRTHPDRDAVTNPTAGVNMESRCTDEGVNAGGRTTAISSF